MWPVSIWQEKVTNTYTSNSLTLQIPENPTILVLDISLMIVVQIRMTC
jgi:hypothetical protein